jgi:hypothetical protein
MKCANAKCVIGGWEDGLPYPPDVADHLVRCDECRNYAEERKALDGWITKRTRAVPEAPDMDRALAALRDAARSGPSPSAGLFGRFAFGRSMKMKSDTALAEPGKASHARFFGLRIGQAPAFLILAVLMGGLVGVWVSQREIRSGKAHPAPLIAPSGTALDGADAGVPVEDVAPKPLFDALRRDGLNAAGKATVRAFTDQNPNKVVGVLVMDSSGRVLFAYPNGDALQGLTHNKAGDWRGWKPLKDAWSGQYTDAQRGKGWIHAYGPETIQSPNGTLRVCVEEKSGDPDPSRVFEILYKEGLTDASRAAIRAFVDRRAYAVAAIFVTDDEGKVLYAYPDGDKIEGRDLGTPGKRFESGGDSKPRTFARQTWNGWICAYCPFADLKTGMKMKAALVRRIKQ